jgi:outer membrane protein with beta-barrel domain
MRAAPISVLLLILTAGAAGSPLAAQRRELSVFAGGNYSKASGGRVAKGQARAGLEVGLGLRLPRSPMLSFQTELRLVQRRFYAERAPSTLPPLQAGPRSDAPKLLFAQVPVLLRIQKGYSTERPVRPFIVLGPYLGIRLACRRELVEANGDVNHPDCSISAPNDRVSPDPFLPALFQDVDVGVLGELGVEVRRLAIGLRGEKSFRNLVEPGTVPTSPLDRSRLWSASLSLEYMVRVL